MRTAYRIMFCLAAVALLALTPPALAAGPVKGAGSVSAIAIPAVQLKHWQNSTVQERRAFLMGFVAMLEMERIWQGKNELAITQSMVPTWSRSLADVSIPQMDNALNEYIQKHPKAMDRTVIDALGRIYIRPALSAKERDDASKRFDMLKADFKQ